MTISTPHPDPQSTGANPRRDAWFAIRGFYYQIQTTVQRWIHLAPADTLQCESAEDIEVLRNAFIDGELRVERVLEQVKVRDTLTLRSEAVVSTIARYFESTATSAPPTLFRFITTAAPGRERGLQFPRRIPGLSAWNATRNFELDEAERRDVETIVHKLFVDARKPADIDDALWNRFQGHLRGMTPQQFGITFIARIEWATLSADVSSLRQQLRSDAIALTLAGTEQDAQVLVDLLVAHVFHFLTTPGLKRLTHEDLRRVAAQSLAPRDSELVRLLETFAEQTSQQLARIESVSDQILGRVNEFGPALTTILQHVQGASAHPVDLLTRSIDEPPHAPALFAERTHLVAQVEPQIQHSVLTAINGPAGMGKTMLALRVYQRWQRSRHWVSLRGLARSDVRAHLHVQLALRAAELAQVALVGDVISMYAEALGDGLLVIDDLPNLTSDRRLADYVAALTAAVESRSGHIVVTTQATVAERLHEVVHRPIHELPIPRMTADEVSDLMSQAQLPDSLRHPQFIDTIVAITSGHPALVAATIRYIQARPSFDELRLVSLLTGDSVKPVRVRTRQSLRDLLPDDAARELLDRLSLTNGKFTHKVVFAVGGVEPRVPRCGELLQELNGVWLTQVGNDRFELSPLLSGIGVETLAPSVASEIHDAIADAYFEEGTIGPNDAMQILVHLFAAKRWLRLAGFLLQLSGHVRTEREAEFFQLVPLLLRPLPTEIPRSAQIGILAAQIRIAQLTGANDTQLEEDFRAIATNPDSAALLSAFIGWLFIGPLSPKTTAAFAAEGAIRASRLYPEVRRRMPEVFEAATTDIHPASLVWAAVTFLSSADDVHRVVDLLCELTDEELRSTFANADIARGVEILTGRIWIVELDKAEEQRTWAPVLQMLDRLIHRAESAGVTPLVFAAQRAKATVLSDHLSKADEALALLTIDAEIHRDAEELLRRHHLTACVLLDHVGPAAALSEFSRALAIDANAEPFIYADAARRASEAAAKLEQWSDAIRHAIRAIGALKRARLPFERVDMVTELSWLQWQRGNRQRAAAALGAVTDFLTANVEVDSERFRESFPKAGHVIGWMGGVAEGEPPKAAWGNTPYNAPYVGFASRSRAALATSDAPLLPPLLLFMQGRFEAAVGLRVRALDHYRRSRAAARAHGIDVSECIAASAQGEVAASIGRIDECVEASLFGVRSYIVAAQAAKGFTFKNQGIEATWASAPITSRAPLERLAFWKTIAAALVGALARQLAATQIMDLIDQFKVAFSRRQPAEPSYWQDLLNLAETHFHEAASLGSIGQAVAASQGQTERLTILYLALINRPDAAPRDICGAEVVLLSAFKSWEPMARSPFVDFAAVVRCTWEEIVRNRPFALNAPRLLRKALEEHSEPSIANAARVLMAAQVATAASLDQSLHQLLATTAETAS